MARLNPRQKDVLWLISKGFHNGEIARQLGLSERTIKHYVSQLLLIFDASNRTELTGLMAFGEYFDGARIPFVEARNNAAV